ncbi:MAG: multifunctional CCA addition/repair protein [Pseudomonadota bacterium]
MQIYAVGGAVRDELLGLPVKDRDYVVVGSTPEAMSKLGYQPVGRDFPVFLHPVTHDEYALARTERKTTRGYKGFEVSAAPEVTLEQDLARRDLTINAIAKAETGELIDPYGGYRDIEARVFRHVSAAFVEDPVRVLRVARFMARFTDFSIAPETLALMREMVGSGEVDHLVAERVWQELARGLMEAQPSRMFETLRACGALTRIMPEVDRLFGVPQPPQYHPEIDTGIHVMLVVDYSAAQNCSLPVRFAALTHDLGKGTTPAAEWPSHHGHEARSVGLVKALCQRIRVPNECRDLALMTARYHGDVHRAQQLRPITILNMLEATDAMRRPERFAQFLQACECDARGRPGFETCDYPAADHLRTALTAAQSVDAGSIAHNGASRDVGERIRAARLLAIRHALGVMQDDDAP